MPKEYLRGIKTREIMLPDLFIYVNLTVIFVVIIMLIGFGWMMVFGAFNVKIGCFLSKYFGNKN